MSWHYQIRQRTMHGRRAFDIVEQYGKKKGYTAEGIAPHGETREEVIIELTHMLRDAQKYRVIVEKEEKGKEKVYDQEAGC